MNPLSAADQSKPLSFLHRCLKEARIPNQRNRNGSAVGQVHNQSLVSQLRSDPDVGHWRPVIIILPASLAWRSSLAHEDNVEWPNNTAEQSGA